MQISIFGISFRNFVNPKNGHWMMLCWNLPRTEGTWLLCYNPGPNWLNRWQLPLPHRHLARASKVARDQAKPRRVPKAKARPNNDGFRSSGRELKKRCCACATRWASVPIRIADLNMLADFRKLTARLAGDLIPLWTMIALLTDFRYKRWRQFHMYHQSILSLSFWIRIHPRWPTWSRSLLWLL